MCLKEKKHLQRYSPEESSHYWEKGRSDTERWREGNVSERDENFYLAFTSRFRAAEGPCPKEGRFNIRLWRLCFTVWDTHSAPFRPINPHSAFNLRVFASYSPSHPYTAPRRRGSVAMTTPGVPAPNRRAPTPRRRRPYEDEKDNNNWWGRKGATGVGGGADRWSAVSRDVAGVKSTIEKRCDSPVVAVAAVRKFIAG